MGGDVLRVLLEAGGKEDEAQEVNGGGEEVCVRSLPRGQD